MQCLNTKRPEHLALVLLYVEASYSKTITLNQGDAPIILSNLPRRVIDFILLVSRKQRKMAIFDTNRGVAFPGIIWGDHSLYWIL